MSPDRTAPVERPAQKAPRDPQIRAALVAHLAGIEPSATVLHEVPIRYARGNFDARRADVIAVSNVVTGYEIKSDVDSLTRLDRQIIAYEALCDFCTIVVGSRHLAHARATVPASWGILLAASGESGVVLHLERLATRNDRVEPAGIARHFWKEECVALLKEHGAKLPRRVLVHALWPLVEALPIDVLRARLRVALVDHENALKDVRVERREEQREHRKREKDRRERMDRILAEWSSRAAERDPTTPLPPSDTLPG